MKVARLLVYEGSYEDMQKQLGRSLPDGVKTWANMSITVTTLDAAEFTEAKIEEKIKRRLGK